MEFGDANAHHNLAVVMHKGTCDATRLGQGIGIV